MLNQPPVYFANVTIKVDEILMSWDIEKQTSDDTYTKF